MKILFLILFLSLTILYAGCKTVGNAKTDLEKRLESLHDPTSKYVLTAAHRALHTKFPENSLAAVRHSIEAGIDMIEIDVRQSADGVLILMHDASVERTTTGKGSVRDLTFHELKNLRLKNMPGEQYIHPVPTLQEVLTLIKNKILVDIDIKDAPVNKLLEIVSEAGTSEQVLFFQHHNVTHDSILTIDQNLMIVPRAETDAQVRDFLSHFRPVTIQIPPEIADPALISEMHLAGCNAWINALGDPDDLAEKGKIEEAFSPLVERGATVIQSDRPDLLLEYLRDTGRHW